jgi:hypothetical protein
VLAGPLAEAHPGERLDGVGGAAVGLDEDHEALPGPARLLLATLSAGAPASAGRHSTRRPLMLPESLRNHNTYSNLILSTPGKYAWRTCALSKTATPKA